MILYVTTFKGERNENNHNPHRTFNWRYWGSSREWRQTTTTPRGERGPPPNLTDAQKSQLDALKAKMDAATSDEERQAIHTEFRALFDSIRASNGEGGRPHYRGRGQETTSSSQGAQ